MKQAEPRVAIQGREWGGRGRTGERMIRCLGRRDIVQSVESRRRLTRGPLIDLFLRKTSSTGSYGEGVKRSVGGGCGGRGKSVGGERVREGSRVIRGSSKIETCRVLSQRELVTWCLPSHPPPYPSSYPSSFPTSPPTTRLPSPCTHVCMSLAN